MEKNYSQIYRDDIVKLVASIVIKSEQTAQAINNGLLVQYGPDILDVNDPTTWKYYLNISGEYHSTDTRITIKSMDTLETIEFSKANLLEHRSTAKAYAFGTNPYKELINQYPNQEMVIRGILYPCDINEAINSKDGTILAYPPSLVEEHEYSLMTNLQTWVYGFLQRWNNVAYNISDELFHVGMLSVLYSCMVGEIFCLRKEACRTNEVHSYHLRNYLASHGIEKYLNYLTREQALWLYRNVTYIERYAGHQGTFEWMVENLFTKRSLPLAAFNMQHDLSDMPEERLKPLVRFHKSNLNGISSEDSRDTFEFFEIFDKENALARDNAKYRDVYDEPAARAMENSKANQLKTKLLETSMVNTEGSEKFLLEEIRFYQWLYMGANGKYRAVIPFTSPVTGETAYLSAIDAFALYAYLYCAVQGIVMEEMPVVTAKRALRAPQASLSDIMSVATKRVPQSFGQKMLDLLPTPVEIISIDLFSEYCRDLWLAANLQWHEVCKEDALDVRGMKHAVMTRCWCNQGIQLGSPGKTYASFFSDNNLDITAYSENELQLAHDSLLQTAVGVTKTDETSLVGIQRAMTEILGQLSSYAIQISRDINATAIRDAGQTAIRTDNFETIPRSYAGVEPDIDVIESATLVRSFRFDNLGSENVPIGYASKVSGSSVISSGLNTIDVKLTQTNQLQVMTGLATGPVLDPLPEEFAHLTNYPGMAHFLTLTEDQKRQLPISVN